jgi:hypothetical protein
VVSDIEVSHVGQEVQSACISLKEHAFNALHEDAAVVEMAGDKRNYMVIRDWAEVRLYVI